MNKKNIVLKDLIEIIPNWSEIYIQDVEHPLGCLDILMTYANSEELINREVISIYPLFNDETSTERQIVIIK